MTDTTLREGAELPTLPEPFAEDLDGELWGQNIKYDAFTADQMNAHYLAGLEAGRATRPVCAHRVADARNPIIKSGYLCVDCGALFNAADHDGATRPVAEAERGRRYQFLLGFLIERGVLTERRYGNGTWSLQGIALVDDSGLRGAGARPRKRSITQSSPSTWTLRVARRSGAKPTPPSPRQPSCWPPPRRIERRTRIAVVGLSSTRLAHASLRTSRSMSLQTT